MISIYPRKFLLLFNNQSFEIEVIIISDISSNTRYANQNNEKATTISNHQIEGTTEARNALRYGTPIFHRESGKLLT